MRLSWITAGVLALALSVNAAQAAERGTKDEAQALVKKAVAFIKEHGAEKAYAEFGNKTGAFVDRDLYIMVYDMTGKCLAHGQNVSQIGKDLIGLKDPDGKAFVQERVEMAKTKDTFWQDYSFKDPLTKTVQPKQAYCEVAHEVIVCSGVYKPE